MIVSPKNVLPSQDYLKADTVRYIFKCLEEESTNLLPPKPIVRTNERGELVAIDGHNLIAVMCHLNQDLDIHLAKSAEDGLLEATKADIERNAHLRAKYDSCLAEQIATEKAGIKTFKDLVLKHANLFI